MHLKFSLFMLLVCIGNTAHAHYPDNSRTYVERCEHNPVAGRICDPHICSPLNTDYHRFIKKTAGSTSLNNPLETARVADYINHAGSQEKQAILDELTQNPIALNNEELGSLVAQEIQRQKEIAELARTLLVGAACVGTAAAAGALLYKYSQS